MPATSATSRTCGKCGHAIPLNAPEGLCPACALLGALQATVPDLDAGATFPFPELTGYEMLEVIGHGGMGIVYKARQRHADRLVALKVILTGTLAGKKEVRRFRAEAQMVARLRHQNIVTIFDVGQENGQHFFSMEHVKGESLADKFRANSLTFEQIAILLQKVALAVDYAHEEGILHRDLKPTNILIDNKGEPRITDFGLAQQLEVPTEISMIGMALGTPSYMPPEQAQGRISEISVASDVYSLGAVLYEGLTGRPPFQAESVLATLTQVVEIPPATPRLLNPKIPRDLEVICLKCLRKQPLQRYASAQALAEDLGRFLRKEPIAARPIGIIERNVGWCLRNPIPAAALATAGLLVVLLAVAAFFFRSNLRENNQVIAQRSSRILTNYLREVSMPVLDLSRDTAFASFLLSPFQTNALAALLERRAKDLSIQPELENVFQNWSVLAPNGDLIVRITNGSRASLEPPVAAVSPNETFFTNRSARNYFQGAMEKFPARDLNAVHYSEGYHSVDDHFSKIGISCAIANPANPSAPVGVVSLMLKAFSTEDTRLGLGDPNVKTLVLARWDQSSTNEAGKIPKWSIWLHPAFKPGTDATPIWEEVDFEKELGWRRFFRSSSYFGGYSGQWLPAFYSVQGTPFVVVVQSRDWVLIFLLITFFCITAAAGSFALYRRIRTRRPKGSV